MCAQSYIYLKFRSCAHYHLATPTSSRKLISSNIANQKTYILSLKSHKTSFSTQKTDWKSDICALRKWEFPVGWEFPKFAQGGKFPKLGNFPGIPVREIPERESLKPHGREGTGISCWTSLRFWCQSARPVCLQSQAHDTRLVTHPQPNVNVLGS